VKSGSGFGALKRVWMLETLTLFGNRWSRLNQFVNG